MVTAFGRIDFGMAGPISILSLAAFALHFRKSLYQALTTFPQDQSSIRELRKELEALDGVIQSLHAAATSGVDLTGLKLLLIWCGKACRDFEALVVKCAPHPGESMTNSRDWARLEYMGYDMVTFKNMLAVYKSTISIALGDAAL